MRHFTITGRDHAIIKMRVSAPRDVVPSDWTVRLLLLGHPDEGAPTPFWPLYDFMTSRWTRSDAWQSKMARALGLFWDYLCARRRRDPTDAQSSTALNSLLSGFVTALLQGTVSDSQDVLGLYWFPQPVYEVSRILNAADRFSDWVVGEHSDTLRALPKVVGGPEGGSLLSRLVMAKQMNWSLRSFLNVAAPTPTASATLGLGVRGSAVARAALSFPADMLETLLWDGFRRSNRPGDTWDDFYVRDMMIFLLQAFAGAREHEPHHLWVVDVIEHPTKIGEASVTLFHPVHGLAFVDDLDGGQIATNRQARLQVIYGLSPRTLGSGSYRVGWKRSKTIGNQHFAYLYWVDPVAAMLFLELYKYYLGRRARVMERRLALGLADHPFLFVSEQESRSESDGYKSIGAPASIESYETALRRAVERCGLTYAKNAGTTSHGLRHSYAYTLRRLGLPRVILQEGLRHSNPFSSDRYGLPTPAEVNDAIKEAVESAAKTVTDERRLARTYAFMADRHPEYVGGAL